MKIVDVKGYTVRKPMYHFYKKSASLPLYREWTWMRVMTDEGIDGFAICPRGAIALDVIQRVIRPLALGEDAMLKEKLWRKIWHVDRSEQIPDYAFSLLDICLWDITAKRARLPLYQLLGGSRDRIAAYASTVCYSDVGEFLDVADQCRELGYHGLKLHAFRDVKKDAALAYALRKHVGDDFPLMYDASGEFEYSDAVYLGKVLHETGFNWFEEPMNENSIIAYKRLCDELQIPVLAAEMSHGRHFNAADFMLMGGADIIRVNVRNKGGFTGALRIAHFADSLNINAEVHGGEMIQLQLALAIPNTTMLESIVYDNPLQCDPPVQSDGYMYAPVLPGVGYDPGLLEQLKKECITSV